MLFCGTKQYRTRKNFAFDCEVSLMTISERGHYDRKKNLSASGSFLAIRCLFESAKNFEAEHPNSAHYSQRHVHVHEHVHIRRSNPRGSHDIGHIQNRRFWITQIDIKQSHGTCKRNIHENCEQNSRVTSRADLKDVGSLLKQLPRWIGLQNKPSAARGLIAWLELRVHYLL